MKKNLYKKYKKQSELKNNEKNNIEKYNILKTILSFSSDLISKIIKTIFYICIVALCSLGATYLVNYIIRGGI